MVISYTTRYDEVENIHYKLYSKLSFRSTAVFWEYYRIVQSTSRNSEDITEMIKNYKSESKAKIRINYTEKGIEFYSPRKWLFPEFYILFK